MHPERTTGTAALLQASRPAAAALSSKQVEMLKSLFNELDHNGDGQLVRSVALVRARCCVPFSAADRCASMFHRMLPSSSCLARQFRDAM